MPVSRAAVLDALRRVKGPDLDGNIVDLGLVSDIAIRDGRVTFAIAVPPARARELEPLRKAAEKVVGDMPDVTGVTVVLTAEAGRSASATVARPSPAPLESAPRRAPGVPGVKHLIAVASGKGGVGKSTVAVNLALGFQAMGLRAGLLDADIFGPSQPKLLGITGRPETADGVPKPLVAHGLKVMSIGFGLPEDAPVILRGPMVTKAIGALLSASWAPLDVLVIDMPPGTGEVQLTIAQNVSLSGAVIVSTPQDLALIDARKGLAMFQKVNVPVLGIIENMSTFVCPKCGERSDIFGHGGAEAEARKLGVPFLGAIPLHMEIRETSDAGRPVTAVAPESARAALFRDIAAKTWSEAGQAASGRDAPPAVEIGPLRDRLIVSFADGRRHELEAELLRVMSPSAEVQGHAPDQRVTVAGKRGVKIAEARPIGNYAARLVFDDGHDTGLFTWSYLDQLGREKKSRWAEYLADLDKKGLGRG